MGQACSECTDAMPEHINTPIIVSNQSFNEIQVSKQTLETLRSLSQNKIPEDFKQHRFYKNAQDTLFIGNINQTCAGQYGILYTSEKTLYYGQFLDGLMDGRGVLKFLDRDSDYDGQFKQGRPHGQGTLSSEKEKFMFQGMWKQDTYRKYTVPVTGILRFQSEKNIIQIRFDSFQHKNAQIIFKNGSKYTGFIDKSSLLPQGNGKMQYKNGDTYQGQWLDGKFQGSGTYIWRNGQRYNGEYFQGLKHGQGNLDYVNGRCFNGIWKNGKREGFGKVISAKGATIQKGIYKNDKFDLQQTKLYLDSYLEKAPGSQLLLSQERQKTYLQKEKQ